MRALVIDDDEDIRHQLTLILNRHGLCHAAANGKQGLSLFREALENGEPYDCVCLDIMMPEMDGHAVLESLRDLEHEQWEEGGSGTRVIMVTSMFDTASVLEDIEDWDAYLVKPVEAGLLDAELERLGVI
ncbi:MAG: response regulator transcription factor [bacterium]|nr:response regulator transcription factor [bacterium]